MCRWRQRAHHRRNSKVAHLSFSLGGKSNIEVPYCDKHCISVCRNDGTSMLISRQARKQIGNRLETIVFRRTLSAKFNFTFLNTIGTKSEPSWNQAVFAERSMRKPKSAMRGHSGTKSEPSRNQAVFDDVLSEIAIHALRPLT